MRKALPLALAFVLALAIAVRSYGASDIPKFDYIPDVILGDANFGQTTANYYIYTQMNMSRYILDESGTSATIKAGIYLVDPTQRGNLSFGGKSQMTASQVLAWERTAAIPDAKNLGGGTTVTVRGTSDLDNMNQGMIVQYQGLFGPHYRFGPSGADSALVQAVAADTISNTTDTTTFWVRLKTGQASSLTSGPVLPTINVTDLASYGFTFWTMNGMVGGVNFGAIQSGFDGSDGVIHSCVSVPSDRLGFGVWEKTELNFGDASKTYGNNLLCASWTLFSDVSAAKVPGVRSRIRPVIPNPTGPATEYIKRTATSELRFDQVVQDYPNTTRMANNHAINLNHYFLHPNVPGVVNSSATVQVSLDIIDYPDLGSGPGLRAAAGSIYIDRLILSVRPKPIEGVDTYPPIYQATGGAQLGPIANWNVSNNALDVPPATTRLGSHVVSIVAAGLQFKSNSAPAWTEQRLFTIADYANLNTDIRNYQGDLLRVRATIKNDSVTSPITLGKADLRLRFTSSYYEPSILLNIPQYWDHGTPSDLSTYVSPSLTGTDYELYLETPAPANPAGDPAANLMRFDWDAINSYHPTAGVGYQYKQAMFSTLTSLRVDTVVKF
ncbi:MAG: hypothetical protein NTX50_04285 [Candidatus Sumerlaeota bacterium]|nr:hypothetical protein [Candidatus Sumerlaeota bacterium]